MFTSVRFWIITIKYWNEKHGRIPTKHIFNIVAGNLTTSIQHGNSFVIHFVLHIVAFLLSMILFSISSHSHWIGHFMLRFCFVVVDVGTVGSFRLRFCFVVAYASLLWSLEKMGGRENVLLQSSRRIPRRPRKRRRRRRRLLRLLPFLQDGFFIREDGLKRRLLRDKTAPLAGFSWEDPRRRLFASRLLFVKPSFPSKLTASSRRRLLGRIRFLLRRPGRLLFYK